ncbi:MAG: hypothetical protein GYA33_04085 [Thermogutta sp.]|nr:hypothetical protein [Thermogutta sp.]
MASARAWLKAVARGEVRPSLGSLTAYVWGLQGTPTGELLEGMTDREARHFLHQWLEAKLANGEPR